MLNIQKFNNFPTINHKGNNINKVTVQNPQVHSVPQNLKRVTSKNVLAYYPSFGKKDKKSIPSPQQQYNTVKSFLNKESQLVLRKLSESGILANNNSNDGSTVLENLYKIATEPRIIGLDTNQILSEVLKALDNPFVITQKFGDIPNNVAKQIENETGRPLPQKALNVSSSCCVVASMEFNLASKSPAEFVRFANGLSGKNYSVDRTVKMSSIDYNYISAMKALKDFKTEHKILNNWDDVIVRIKPDRNAIVRARVQTSYKDPGERSCIDVLIQSALLNLGSQHTYDAMTDERAQTEFNQDTAGLTESEKDFVENVVFDRPKASVVYQNLNEEGYLQGYFAEQNEVKQQILKTLELGQNVIVGITFIENNKVEGGHEMTIVDYKEDKDGIGYFICNDTDDNIDKPVTIKADKLIPMIHHAGVLIESLGENFKYRESWRDILDQFKNK